MPIGSIKTTTPKTDKSAAASSSSAGPGGGGRTTFRPPWVKADVPEVKPKTTMKTTPPWAKKSTTTEPTAPTKNDAVKKNGETPSTKVASSSPSSGGNSKPVSKTVPAVAVAVKPLTEAAPVRKEAKLQSREIKVPIVTEKRKPIQEPLIKPKPKKPPTPSESEEEESDDDDEDETETDSESESEEAAAPKQAETELQRKFQAEKPKMRPIVVKRDKSMSNTQKKRDEEDDDEAVEGETDEDRERRRRFKLDRPKLRHVVVNKQKSFNKSIDDFDKIRPVLKKVQKVDEVIKESEPDVKPEFKDKVLKKVIPIKKEPSKANVPAPPPLPSLVPKPPPPPPPPLGPPTDFQKKELNEKQKATIEKLKTRPRRRPDWSEMMKEVEGGKKLRHVQCNDRSQPIITCKSMTKVDDKFVYETEKDNAHNKLLKQIQGGIRLKTVKTNDRSRPFLDGLRKFRRQMTIEEQIQKSESKANLSEVPQEPDEPSGDELDDIDKLRDDLQSTKQMLALELRNREAQERENKRLLARIANLEAELQRDKTRGDDKEESSKSSSAPSSSGADDALVQSLKKDAEEARNISKELEKKFEKSAEQLDAAKNEVEDQKRMIQQLEKKLAQALQQSPVSNNIRPQFSFCYSSEDPSDSDIFYNFRSASPTELQQEEEPAQIINNNFKQVSNHITNSMNSLKGGGSSMNGSRRPSEANPNKESSPELELELSESDEDEDEEKKAERRQRRLAKEVKILKTKLTKLKDKQEAAKRERANLKQIMKKNHVLLKEENKKFKKLEKEVHKMAASMKEEVDEDDEDKDDDDEEEEEAEEEQESEEESEEESESEESEEESGSETESESEAEDASDEDKKNNLEPRVKAHENRLSALKKGNVLLQANVDNLQDEISKVREKASSLQAELDAVLADLGL